MDDVLARSERVSGDELRRLLQRRDTPGCVHLGVQLVSFITAAGATVALAAAGDPRWMATVAVCGAVLATFFPAMHEAGHGTAFRSAALNRAVTWLAAVLMLQVPSFFREFHWEHHRETQNPARDPEIARAPRLLAPWPSNPFFYLVRVSGQLIMVGKGLFTLVSAVLPTAAAWARVFPFVRAAQRRRVAWESRAVVLAMGAACFAGLRFVPGFAALLLAWPIAHVVLGFYLMPEHTGLPADGSQFHRTRTIRSNAVVRWLMWNMPYHAEHHAYPGVPFHAVPALHRVLAPELEHVATGYLAFHVEALRRACGRA